MQKNVGILVGLLAIALVIALVWMVRGRAPEDVMTETVETEDIIMEDLTPASPVTGEEGVTREPASPEVVSSAAVTVTTSGLSPASVTIPVGGTATFTNADQVPHEIASGPHPTHTSYPPLNGPVLGPGASFTVTFSEPGTYSVHDHLNPSLTGTVVVE